MLNKLYSKANLLVLLVLVFVASGFFTHSALADSSYVLVNSWGSYGTGDGQFNQPYAIAIDDSSNDVYVSDSHNGRVQKFDASGNFLLKWGSYGSGDGQFGSTTVSTVTGFPKTTPISVGAVGSPYGITVDSSGNIYVVDSGNGRIEKFDPSGNFLLKWGGTRPCFGFLYRSSLSLLF